MRRKNNVFQCLCTQIESYTLLSEAQTQIHRLVWHWYWHTYSSTKNLELAAATQYTTRFVYVCVCALFTYSVLIRITSMRITNIRFCRFACYSCGWFIYSVYMAQWVYSQRMKLRILIKFHEGCSHLLLRIFH